MKKEWIFLAVVIVSAGMAVLYSRINQKPKVIYTMESGEQKTELTGSEGNISYKVIGGESIPSEAKKLHEQARVQGSSGNMDGAVDLLNQAIALAPDWPYPHYDLAYTYLMLGKDNDALGKYRDVDKMAPDGFFTTKTALWALERESQGTFPKGTYLSYLSLEWMDAVQRSNKVEQMIAELPSFVPLWMDRADLSSDPSRKIEYIEKGLSLDPDIETAGMLLLNKAAWLQNQDKSTEALALLDKLIESKQSTLATRTLAGEVKKMIKR